MREQLSRMYGGRKSSLDAVLGDRVAIIDPFSPEFGRDGRVTDVTFNEKEEPRFLVHLHDGNLDGAEVNPRDVWLDHGNVSKIDR